MTLSLFLIDLRRAAVDFAHLIQTVLNAPAHCLHILFRDIPLKEHQLDGMRKAHHRMSGLEELREVVRLHRVAEFGDIAAHELDHLVRARKITVRDRIRRDALDIILVVLGDVEHIGHGEVIGQLELDLVHNAVARFDYARRAQLTQRDIDQLAGKCGCKHISPLLLRSVKTNKKINGRNRDRQNHGREADLEIVAEGDRMTVLGRNAGQNDVRGRADQRTVAAEARAERQRPPERGDIHAVRLHGQDQRDHGRNERDVVQNGREHRRAPEDEDHQQRDVAAGHRNERVAERADHAALDHAADDDEQAFENFVNFEQLKEE